MNTHKGKTIQGPKDLMQELRDWIAEVTLSDHPVAVTNDLQHKAALQLIAAGYAVATKKKQYGHIAEVKGINS